MLPVPTPSVPTDNLYKFMAVFGLILMLAGVLAPYPLESQYQVELEGLREKYLSGLSKANAKIRELQKSQTDPEKLLHDGVLKTPQEAFFDEADKHETYFKSHLDRRWKKYVEQIYLSNWLIVGGCVFGLIGFSFWFWKVQRYHDKILKLEFEEKKKSLAT